MSHLVACHDCDALFEVPSLREGTLARCPRCGSLLLQRKHNSLERTLALTLAGLILFIVANCFPFLGMQTAGMVRETTLVTGIHELYNQELWGLATLVLLTCVIFPVTEMSCLLYLLVPLRFGRVPLHFAKVLRLIHHIRPWSMMEIFMLGILVALVKLAKMATIIPGTSLYAFGVLIIVLAAASTTLDVHLLWSQLDHIGEEQ